MKSHGMNIFYLKDLYFKYMKQYNKTAVTATYRPKI